MLSLEGTKLYMTSGFGGSSFRSRYREESSESRLVLTQLVSHQDSQASCYSEANTSFPTQHPEF